MQGRGGGIFILVWLYVRAFDEGTPIIDVIPIIAIFDQLGIRCLCDGAASGLAHHPIAFAEFLVRFGNGGLHQFEAAASVRSRDLECTFDKTRVAARTRQDALGRERTDIVVDRL